LDALISIQPNNEHLQSHERGLLGWLIAQAEEQAPVPASTGWTLAADANQLVL
jgi:hypothetical protein